MLYVACHCCPQIAMKNGWGRFGLLDFNFPEIDTLIWWQGLCVSQILGALSRMSSHLPATRGAGVGAGGGAAPIRCSWTYCHTRH